MLKEYKIVPDRGHARRWFKDGAMDLVVWTQPTRRFEITYQARIEEGRFEQRVISFIEERGLKHSLVLNEALKHPSPKRLEELKQKTSYEDVITHLKSRQGDLPSEILDEVLRVLES